MYPQASEHGHPNLSWAEAAYTTHTGGVTGSFYSTQAAQQSPPWSPENANVNNYGNHPANTQNGRLLITYNKTELDSKAKDAEQAESDAPSDSEAHTPGISSYPQVFTKHQTTPVIPVYLKVFA